MRWRAHEWRTINLDNGVDLSIWRQFDRTDRNALQPFSGATTSSPTPGVDPEYADDIEVSIDSYVRWPEVGPNPGPAAGEPRRYLPDRHRLTSRKLDLDLTGEPLVPAPAHGLPLEYMEGPYHYRGTLRGEPVSGFAFYERSLALYRDWELVDVLASVVGERGWRHCANWSRPGVATKPWHTCVTRSSRQGPGSRSSSTISSLRCRRVTGRN